MMVGAAAEKVGAAAVTEMAGAAAEMAEEGEKERNKFCPYRPVHSWHSTRLRRRSLPCRGLRWRHHIGHDQSLH